MANKTLFSYSDSKETSYTMTASTNNDGYPFYIKYSDDRVLNNNGQSSVYFDTWTTVDGGNSWAITEVDCSASAFDFVSTLASVSSACSETVGVPFGRTAEAQSTIQSVYNQYSSYNISNLPSDVSAAVESLNTALSTYNSSAVQELTDGTQAILGNQQHTSLYVRAKETNRNSATGGWLGSYGNKDNYRYLFTFKKNTDGTWKMYSDYYGKYVGAVPSANNLEFQLVDESSACNFTIEASSTVGYGVIYDATCTTTSGDVTVNALHMTNWSNSPVGNGVVRWGMSANASHFKFITDINETLTAWNKTLTDEAAKTGTVIGTYENTEALQNALTAFNNAAQTEKGVKAKALEEALAAAAIVPEAGAYYTITNANKTTSLLCEDYANQTNSNNNAAATSLDANNAPYLWQFEAVSNYMDKFNSLYKVKTANSGNYLSKSQWAYGTVNLLASSNSNVGSYDFFDKQFSSVSNTCTFTYWTDEAHSDRGTMTANSDATTLSSWNAANSGLNNWTITKVTTIPVTISEAKYATLELPFAVTLPEGLKAYKGTTDEENYLSLTEITGSIPANEPVILTGEAATYTLTISSSTDAASTDNVLSGTLTPATLTSDNTAYILKNGTSGVGLYKVTSTSDLTIPANKAYLLETSGSSQSMKGFRFDDGTTTGIHSAATTNDAADEFYDLNGRRVLFPIKGVYVKGNGQKVYIK